MGLYYFGGVIAVYSCIIIVTLTIIMEVYFNMIKGKAHFDHLHNGLFTLWMIKHSFPFDF